MAIKTNEFIKLMQSAYLVLPKLIIGGKEEIFFENLNELRLQYSIIKKEYNHFCVYPGHNTDKLHEAIEIMNDYCKQTDVRVQWFINEISEIRLSKENWTRYRDQEPFVWFWYENVNITSLIDI